MDAAALGSAVGWAVHRPTLTVSLHFPTEALQCKLWSNTHPKRLLVSHSAADGGGGAAAGGGRSGACGAG